MTTCPFCHGLFTEGELIEHITCAEKQEGYAQLMAIGLRFRHQEGQQEINRVLRGLR